jgi:hypothetical protein
MDTSIVIRDPGKVGDNGIQVFSFAIYRRDGSDFAITLPELFDAMCCNCKVKRERGQNS